MIERLHYRFAQAVAVAALGMAIPSLSAFAQIAPAHLYYGVGREIGMKVEIPKDRQGDASISLLAVDGKLVASAPVKEGEINLATLFPELWTKKSPDVQFAQLVVGKDPVGPAVVLQPMVAPKPAVSRGGGPPTFVEIPPEQRTYSGIRAYVDKVVVVETTMGEMVFRLRPDAAPNTAWNFRQLVEGGFYTDVIFHRVVAKLPNPPFAPFVIQVGDPTGSGLGGPGYNVDLEDSAAALPHDFGVLSMARSPDANSGGSQVFVCLSREGTAFLDRSYTTFAQAVSGAEVIEKIAAVPVDRTDRPNDPPKIKTAKLVDAPPHGTGPAPVQKAAAAGAPR
jgi:cyclophilin family peptidyl-prolyl cis-trans isomerase